MASINTTDLEPGMVLDKDLRSPQGRLLLSRGEPLECKHITLCKRWGIPGAEIANITSEEIAGKAQKSFSPVARELSKALAQKRFCSLDLQHPACKEILRQFLLHAARKIDAGVIISGDSTTISAPAADEQLPPLPTPEAIVGKSETLATLPQTYAQIVEALDAPNASAAYVAEVISRDSSLSAKLLRLVNSPFYGFRQRVDSLDRAVALVGSSQLSTLALGISVFSLFKGVPSSVYSLEEYCRHSVACGIVARTLAGYCQGVNRERMFALGLLHDIGRLVICLQHPVHCKYMMEISLYGRSPLYAVEQQMLGWNHASLSQELLTFWGLPEELCQGVGNHHPPFTTSLNAESKLLHVADVLAHALVLGNWDALRIPPLDISAWESLAIDSSVIAAVMQQTEPLIEDMFRALFQEAV